MFKQAYVDRKFLKPLAQLLDLCDGLDENRYEQAMGAQYSEKGEGCSHSFWWS